jgi:ribose transport system substrate-binding protein
MVVTLRRSWAALLACLLACCARDDSIRLAFVSNNASDFWTICRRGCEAAAAELPGIRVDFRMPPENSAASQQQILHDLLAAGVKGIAISPVDPANQTEMLNEAAKRAALVCSDSDAPHSARLAYIGTDNVAAGRQAGEVIRRVLPEGGTVFGFVGSLDANNAIERLRGIQDSLEGTKVRLVRVLTDDADRVRAKTNVLDVLTSNPGVGCLVGIWSYNGPAILNAVRERGRIGKVQIVCFDEEDETLQGVADGAIAATVVQQPYEFGYRSIKLLAAIVGGTGKPPAGGLDHVATKVIDQDQVGAFWSELRRIRGR